MRLGVAVAVACLLGTGFAFADPAWASVRKPVDIGAQGLGAALQSFAKERDVQIVYRSEVVGSLKTNGAAGELTVEEALSKLLEGTGLTFQYLEDKGVTIVPIATAPVQKSVEESKPVAAAEERKGFWSRLRLAQAETASADASAASSEGVKLEEVIVSAQKREERLQDVPISISVLSGEDLDRSAALDVREELRRVPGVTTNEVHVGGVTQVTVRGVAAATIDGGSSTTGYYLDGAPFGLIRSAFGPDSSAYDLEQVEVLRGPQGTLYGVNAFNGVVRVLTKDADLNDFELKARTSAGGTKGGDENYRGDLAVNVPIVDGKLAARAVLGYQKVGGWIDKPNFQRNANDGELRNLRLKLNAQPTEQLSIGLSAWSSRSDYDAPPVGEADMTRPFAMHEPISSDYDVYGLKVGYDFPGFSVTSMTSHLDYSQKALLGPVAFEGKLDAKTFSQEFNLISTHEGPWRWTAGGIYKDTEDRSESTIYLIPGLDTPAGDVLRSKSYAVFGELTRLFLDGKWAFTAGLRHFEEDLTRREFARWPGLGSPGALTDSDDKFHATTPRVVLTWHPSQQVMGYASYGEGFRSGLPQSVEIQLVAPDFPAAKSDRLKNYELGVKGDFWSGRLGLDAALYYLDWQDILSGLTVTHTVDGQNVFFAAFVNGTSASGIGFDLGVTAQPVDRLELGVSFNWNDLGMDTDVLSGGQLLFRKGRRPLATPEWTLGASADYVFPIGGSGFEARISTSLTAIPERDTTDEPRRQAGILTVADELLNARASISISAPRNWTATLFVDNVKNENGVVYRPGNPANVMRAHPRTVGVQFEYELGGRRN